MSVRAACLLSLAISLAVPALTSAAPSLNLRSHEIGVVDSASTFDRHYLAYQAGDALRVVDDRTGAQYNLRLPAACAFQTVRFPEALLTCGDMPDRRPNEHGRPRIIDLRSGAVTDLDRDDDAQRPRNDGYVTSTDSYYLIGRQWIAGSYDTFEPHVPTGRVYLNRATGERREGSTSIRLLDLDSPTLAPFPPQEPACEGPAREYVDPSARRWLRWGGPRKQWLILERCGAPARVISRCPKHCGFPVLAGGVVAWPGARSVTVHAIRSGKRATFRFPRVRYQGFAISVSATTRRLLIEVPRPYSGPARYSARLHEVRLPAHLR